MAEYGAILKLREDNGIVLLLADKGNATVIMEEGECNMKIEKFSLIQPTNLYHVIQSKGLLRRQMN